MSSFRSASGFQGTEAGNLVPSEGAEEREAAQSIRKEIDISF
jgi:hypothetical protein